MAKAIYCNGRDGTRIRYEIRGEGEPLALIMGYGGSSRTWGEPFIAAIAERFRTLLIDNRGTGESDHPDHPWTLPDMADDVAAVLDDAGIARAHVYGISMGGMIAQEFALNHPERLRGLVLGCTNCGFGKSVLAPPAATAALAPDPNLPMREQARRMLVACCSPAFLAARAGQAIIDERILEMSAYPATPLHSYSRQWEAIAAFDSLARLGQIKASTMVITGSADPIVPAANAELLHHGIPGSKVHVIEGAGHLFFWEAPEESAEVPGDFLARH